MIAQQQRVVGPEVRDQPPPLVEVERDTIIGMNADMALKRLCCKVCSRACEGGY
jgi:hypothetical protein